ncbi:glutamate receptor 1-like [Haliotis rubra]|uniref:glutamate receptor 1-like n=1 Tax=Haliotis rubra TaxID=36100 RepID=UPI001EE5FAD0|nr:glutamate receptor 1-like [Haliotis rubra]
MVHVWIFVLIFMFGIIPKGQNSSQKVPIGVILDDEDSEVRREIQKAINFNNVNNSRSRIIINASYSIINIRDSYQLSAAICDQLDRGVFILFGASSAASYNTIQSYSQALKIPYFLFTPTRNEPGDGYAYDISISPSYTSAVIDIIKFYGWSKIYFLFDSDDGLWQLQNIYDAFREPNTSLVVDAQRLRAVAMSRDVLRKLDRSDRVYRKRIVVSLRNVSSYQVFLNQIVDVGMNREDYHYVIAGPDIELLDLKSFLHGGVNVTGFRLLEPRRGESMSEDMRAGITHGRNLNRLGKPTPLKFRESTEAALAADGIKVVSRAFNLLLDSPTDRDIYRTFRHGQVYNDGTRGVKCRDFPIKPWTHGFTIKKAITKVKIRGRSKRIGFHSSGIRQRHKLDVLQLEYKQKLRKVGTWSKSDGFNTSMARPEKETFPLPANRTRIVTTILVDPFVIKDCPPNGSPCTGNERFQGYCVDLARHVAELVKFDYVIELVKDGGYGGRLPNNSWTGMIGELIREEADVAIAPLTITKIRERVVDFSKPFMNTGISIMIKIPDKQKPGIFSFMDPFSKSIWLCITLGFLAVSFVLFLVGKFSPFEWDVECTGEGQSASTAFTLCNTLWFALGALMQQGSDISPRSFSGRIVGSAWWFFTLILISSYTANLAAFLTIERMFTPIDSADDLVKQTEIKYGPRENGSTYEFFRDSEVTVYKQMWNSMMDAVPSSFVSKVDEGVERVRSSKGKFAFLLESAMNEYFNQRKPCNTMKVGRNLDSKGYGIATTLGSDLRDPINIAVLELREVGVLHKMEQKWWYDKGQCGKEGGGKDTATSALTLSNVSGIFHILISGLVLAILVAFMDFLIKNKLRGRSFKSGSRMKGTAVVEPKKGRQLTRLPRSPLAEAEENGTCSFKEPTDRQLISFDPLTDEPIHLS